MSDELRFYLRHVMPPNKEGKLCIRARSLNNGVASRSVAHTPGAIMHIVWTILVGFIVGVVAKMLMPGKDPGGFFITALLGIAGSFLAKYIGLFLNLYREEDAAGFIMSVIGALILLFVYHKFFNRTASAPRT